MKRLCNPLGTKLANIKVFGDRLLALTDDGRRLLVWDTSNAGMSRENIYVDFTLDAP